MAKYVIVLVLLLLSSPTFSQFVELGYPKGYLTVPESDRRRITIGNLNNRVRPYMILTTVDSFKQQKTMTVAPGYTFQQATIYFSGAGFPNVNEMECGDSIYWLMQLPLADSLKNGTIITFDEIKLIDNKTNKVLNAGGMSFIFDIKDAHLPNKDQLEFHNLKNTFYFSGNIYFSGTNFSQVYTLRLNPSQPARYNNIFSKTTIGSVVTFENVVYRNTDGSLSKPLSKTIKVTAELMDHCVVYQPDTTTHD